ncbi:hypothetical protein [Ruminococcus sp.]|uniref:hypothetical protein n=1 Tax=Ruminococcus sp. TaxID=41978 RepID=UPI001B660BF6|nr:hypothetical protein [Ruminococcus sp.]MBP5433721.1 hypothetical protein [Ruminococcus sp.]
MRAVRHKRADVIRQFIRGECAVAVDDTNYAEIKGGVTMKALKGFNPCENRADSISKTALLAAVEMEIADIESYEQGQDKAELSERQQGMLTAYRTVLALVYDLTRSTKSRIIEYFLRGDVFVVVNRSNYHDFLTEVEKADPKLRWANGVPCSKWAPYDDEIPYLLDVTHYPSGTRSLGATYYDEDYNMTALDISKDSVVFWSQLRD